MKLTLTYQGPLPPIQRGVSAIKADLRRVFHPQIKSQVSGRIQARAFGKVTTEIDGHTFIAPVNRHFRTAAELSFLLLTPLTKRLVGDIDNRLKTLIDGLTRPANSEQMRGHHALPAGEPTYCLMEDDALVKQISIDSRQWWEPQLGSDDVFVVVTANIILDVEADMDTPFDNLMLLL